MGSRLGWFVLGVLSGMAAMAVMQRVIEEREVEDVEALAESISERLSALESGFTES